MEHGLHIELAAEHLGNFLGLPITNTLVTSWIVVVVLAIFAFFLGRNLQLVPGRLQVLIEEGFRFVFDYVAETLESAELARKFFPLLMTIFLFIFTANMLQFLPIVGSLKYLVGDEFISLLRPVATDLNVTLALAIISLLAIEITGVAMIGFWKYGGKFISFKSPIAFAIGIIELFSEMARLISFSFRLFGNMFAGKVLVLVVAAFIPFILPVPILLFEVFVGLIQAAIFALLTLFFIKIAIAQPAH